MAIHLIERFAPVIRALTAAELDGAASLNHKLCLAREGDVEVCYAPFEYINPQARVVIVGITPGRTQMLNALREARKQLDLGRDLGATLLAAKQTGAFSGAMRPNLIRLLDRIGIHALLNIPSCAALFGSAANLVQTTSVLRNPVFVRGDNYNGAPNMTRHPLLRDQLVTHFGEDLKALPHALFVPLGDKVAEALHFLADRGLLDHRRILDGLPHPSGANAERIAYFLGQKDRTALSAKTNADKLDHARTLLVQRVRALT